MGNQQATFFEPDKTILIAGLENSGKTSILRMLQQGHAFEEPPLNSPTPRFNSSNFRSHGYNLKVYDLGGKEQFRNDWNQLLHQFSFDALVYVVDASDEGSWEESRKWLHRIVENEREKLKQMPVILIANKMDCTEKHAMHKIKTMFTESNSTMKELFWICIGASVVQNVKLFDALEWMLTQV